MSEQERPAKENPKNHPDYVECPEQYKEKWYAYCEYVEEVYDKETTRSRRKQASRYWFAWCAENDVDPWTDEERKIGQYVDDHRHLGDQSISARVTGVSMLHEWAYEQEIIDHQNLVGYSVEENIKQVDPTSTQKSYQETVSGRDKNYHYITPDEMEQMIENVPSPKTRNTAILKCLWQGGMRSVELANLTLNNVETEENRIVIQSAKKDPKKDDNYWRPVYMQDDAFYWLNRWIEKKRHTLGPYDEDSEYVFLTHQNPKMRPSHISRIVKESAENAGISEKIGEDGNGNTRWKHTAHAVRHGHAHHVCNFTDTPLQIVARQLGHSIDTLVSTYVQGDDEAHENWYRENDDGPKDVL
jgi:site-specific recombinase XerD